MPVLAADELRLLYAVLLNALVLWASWRFARRFNADALAAAGDAGLLYYLVQYVSVCAMGAVGALHPLTIALVALLASSVLTAVGGWRQGLETSAASMSRFSRSIVSGAIAFVIAYLVALAWQWSLPVISNDALTYHLPAAVQWMQDGRLSFYEAWLYNPANSYSPLGGSAFLAWLIAPLGNDAVARFAQAGPALLLLIAMLNLCAALGAGAGSAALIAAACVLSRPFASQAILAKDDLWLAAFCILLIDAARRERLADRFGPWRAGIALGLLLATKYTVLFSLPILLLMIPLARRRASETIVAARDPRAEGESLAEPSASIARRPRGSVALPKGLRRPHLHAAIIVGVVLVLAGPWYLRNWRVSGNPLYPTSVKLFGVTLFPGMLDVHRSDLLATPRGVWEVFTGGYYGTTVAVAVVLLVAWMAAWVVSARKGWRDVLRDPLQRACLVGPLVGIGLFAAAAPYGEMRFAYPSVALLFASAAVALAPTPPAIQIGAAAAVMLLSAATAFRPEAATTFTAVAAVAGIVAAGTVLTRYAARVALVAGAAAVLLGGMTVYVQWSAYLRGAEEDAIAAWSNNGVYGAAGAVWGYVRSELPPGATLAYANTYFTYPLMGPRYDHRVVHAPTRAGLERFIDMPRIDTPMTGEAITGHVVTMLRENPDREAWLRRLRESKAEYLVVMSQVPGRPDTVDPPEAKFAADDPRRFIPVFANDGGIVYRINW